MVSGLELFLCFVLALIGATGGYLLAVFICRDTQFSLRYSVRDLQNYFVPNDDEFSVARRKRQLNIILSSAGVVALVNLFNASVLAVFLFNDAGVNVIWWALTIGLMASFQLKACMRIRKKAVSTQSERRIIKRVIFNVVVFGFVWGAPATLFYADASETGKMILLLTLLGTTAGGAAAYAFLPPAAILFSAMIGAHVVFALFSNGMPGDVVLAALAMSMLFTLGAVSSGVYQAAIREPALNDMESESEPASHSGHLVSQAS